MVFLFHCASIFTQEKIHFYRLDKAKYPISKLNFVLSKKCSASKIVMTQTTFTKATAPSSFKTPSTNSLDDHDIMTSSSARIVMVTLFTCFILLVGFCCFKKCRMQADSKQLESSPSKEIVGARLVGTYKKGLPVVFDGESTTTEKMSPPSPLLGNIVIGKKLNDNDFASYLLKSQEDENMVDLTLQKKVSRHGNEIRRPPPPPYLTHSIKRTAKD